MAEEPQPQEINKEELFSYLVSTFYSSAWMQMGKMANPMTNKVEKDMEQAEFTIDLLDMLKEKTEGNLSDEESKLLTRAIKELKMNFMEEKKKGGDSGEEAEDAEGKSSQTRPDNIVTPNDAMGNKKEDDSDSGKQSNLWTP
ncbi:MAG: DUF1844 domain-containing protein [Candidatus Marinimicrobia bacterium]|nr:DUF1844 domain-containing protein [Candidatus Neomarinimicrobiota bacterium]MCF7828438.1 DUF1844 domain-containing protein [Candidatus Neomarinimicrobiota bacterium]MCF7880968.1 DUF1844 domain-containing protein [Candidatus Neomarinimicrobiota bacterium]